MRFTVDQKQETVNEIKEIALDLVDECIALLNSNGEYTYLNRAHVELYGAEAASELLGRKWHLLYEQAEIERLEREAFPVIAATGSWRGETLGRRKDGTPINQFVSLTALPDGGLICLAHITDREKEILAQLRQRTSRMDSIVRNISDGILLETVDREIVAINASLGQMAGLPLAPDEVVGTSCLDALPLVQEQASDPEAFRSQIEKRVIERVAVFDERVELKNGHVLSRDFIPVRNGDDVEGFLWVYHDVTEQERVKEELKSLVKRERELNKVQGQFLHLISHEFKKPILNTLRGATILKSALSDDEKNAQMMQSLEYIVQEMERLNRNVNRMVSYQSILSSRSLSLRPVRAVRLISNFLNYNYGMFTDSLKFVVRDDIPLETEILADMEMLELVLTNLIDNALKYSAFHQSVHISSQLNEAGDVVWKFVNPMREGPAPEMALLGRPLYRGSETNDSGLGLGLSIVGHIVHLFGGTLEFTSEDNNFIVTLTLSARSDAPDQRSQLA